MMKYMVVHKEPELSWETVEENWRKLFAGLPQQEQRTKNRELIMRSEWHLLSVVFRQLFSLFPVRSK